MGGKGFLMKKWRGLLLILPLLLASCDTATKNESQRFHLQVVRVNEINEPDIYMVDTEKGKAWKLVFHGFTDDTSGFYPLKFRADSYDKRKEFSYEAINAPKE